jgi:ankyrin repeat protein
MEAFDGPSPITDFYNAAGLDREKKKFFDAVENNDAEAAKCVLGEHPDAILWRNADGLTGLMVASKAGAKDAVQALLEEGANTEIQNSRGSTALMFAAYAGKAVVAQMLLNAGADPNHANYQGDTPLMTAAAEGCKNTLVLLLSRGADPALKSKDEKTALDFAVENEQKVVEALLRDSLANPPPKPDRPPRQIEAAESAAPVAEETPPAPVSKAVDMLSMANKLRAARLA